MVTLITGSNFHRINLSLIGEFKVTNASQTFSCLTFILHHLALAFNFQMRYWEIYLGIVSFGLTKEAKLKMEEKMNCFLKYMNCESINLVWEKADAFKLNRNIQELNDLSFCLKIIFSFHIILWGLQFSILLDCPFKIFHSRAWNRKSQSLDFLLIR